MPASPSTPRRRPAIRRSSRSPAPWPNESLTSLKLSRSTSSSATARPGAPAAVHAAAQLGLELGAVGQPGQRVEVGEAGDLLLGAQALGDVLARGEDADHLAGRVAQQRVAPGDRAALAGAGDDVALVVGERLLVARSTRWKFVAPGLAVVLGDDGVVPVPADQLAVLVAEQLAAVAVEQLDGLVGAQDEQDRAGDVEVVLGARLGQLALGDVDHHALGVRGAAVVVADDRVALPDPHDASRRRRSGGTRGRTRSRAGRCASPPSARPRGRPDADARPTAPARPPSARRGSRAPPRSGERRTRTATQAPTGPHTTPPAPAPPGSGSGDRRVRAPPAYAPRAEPNRKLGYAASSRRPRARRADDARRAPACA